MVRFLLIISFIRAAFRHRVHPYRFFQLNGEYFNEKRGLFSKLEMDSLIPDRYRLAQELDDGISEPTEFPIFIKPEWGQNSHGITRVDSMTQLVKIRRRNSRRKTRFLIQEVAEGSRELEIFYIRSAGRPADCAVLSITETLNDSGEPHPVNGIYNPHCSYHDLTGSLHQQELNIIWDRIKQIGRFRIARIGLRTDGIGEMLEGKFKIVEMNIFLPMPLMLLDKTKGWSEKQQFIQESMDAAARMVVTIPPEQKRKNIFMRKLLAHYRVKL